MGNGWAGLLPGGDPFRSPAGQEILARIGETAVLRIDRLVDFDVDYGYAGAATEKKRDNLNTWEFDLASWASVLTYEPPVAAADNVKPVMFAVGELDPLAPPSGVKAVAERVGGPVEVFVLPQGVHQLMLFHTEDFIEKIRDFVARTVLTRS
jgi:pimeloyl-ACP methyl ester carboxylesterase